MFNHGRKFLFAILATVLAAPAFATVEPEAVPGEFVVKLRASQFVGATASSLGQALNSHVRSVLAEQNLVVVQRPVVETRGTSVAFLSNNAIVEYAEPNFIYRATALPNDTDIDKLWGMKNTGANTGVNAGVAGIDVDAERAWDITTGSKEVIVAVIDTGVDYNHPDLKDNMWINEAEANGVTGVDDDGNGYVDDIHGMNFSTTTPSADPLDDHGHGSHCSGTIGGSGNNGLGVAGVNWNVRIMPVKFLTASGSGTLDAAVLSVDYATKMGAKLSSNSWGCAGCVSQALQEAVERANTAGSLFIAAAGNNSTNNDVSAFYPANYPSANIISVAAIDNQGKLANFSNYGKTTVHLAAPGVDIYSTYKNGMYAKMSGTSMATPHVAGVTALLASHEPNLTGAELKERLLATSRPLYAARGKTITGGIANAYYALTNTPAPVDQNDPINWTAQALTISSKHPYDAETKESYEVNVPGATQLALYFSKVEFANLSDKLTFYNRDGVKIGEVKGKSTELFSQFIAGDYVRIEFTTDKNFNGYGFDLTSVAFR